MHARAPGVGVCKNMLRLPPHRIINTNTLIWSRHECAQRIRMLDAAARKRHGGDMMMNARPNAVANGRGEGARARRVEGGGIEEKQEEACRPRHAGIEIQQENTGARRPRQAEGMPRRQRRPRPPFFS